VKNFSHRKGLNIGARNCRMWKRYLETSRTTNISRGFIFVDWRKWKLGLDCWP